MKDWKAMALLAVTVIVMETALIWALGVAPTDRRQGDIQRIFYFHLGSIWPGFLAFFYVLYASIRYLMSRREIWDQRALAAGEIGLTFSTIVLVTGPIWAKPAWGIWWTWDARLSSMLALWILFLVYVNLREYIRDESARARINAVLGIIGGCMVPFVYMSTRMFETQHPGPVIAGDEESGIKDSQMQIALLLALAGFTLLFFLLRNTASGIFGAEARMRKLNARLNLLKEHR